MRPPMFAAAPPDVRKGFAFPALLEKQKGYARWLGAGPTSWKPIRVSHSLTAHQAAEPRR